MNERAPVSVVIPTFNRSKFLQVAIESVLEQTVRPLEVIVVDHASTDDTAVVIGSFGKDVRSFRLENSGRGGPAIPRNAGIQRSSGEWIAFLDDDDLWEPGKLERQMECLRGPHDPLLVSTDATVITSSGQPAGPRYLSHTFAFSGEVFRRMLRENFLITSSVLVRHAPLLEAGGFDVRPSLHMVEDYHLWLRLAALGEFRHIDEPLVRYRRNLQASSRSGLQKALRRRRTALRAALEDRQVANRAAEVRLAIVRDYARSAISLLPRRA